eukprot:6204395-Pleurochrysis_carterae.AAC.1
MGQDLTLTCAGAVGGGLSVATLNKNTRNIRRAQHIAPKELRCASTLCLQESAYFMSSLGMIRPSYRSKDGIVAAFCEIRKTNSARARPTIENKV